jgi:pyridoxamine 5'-phosphate oxidase
MSITTALRSLFTIGKGVLRGLSEETAGDDPIGLFRAWYEDARRSGLYLPEAMTLATATPEGAPSARMMLLKGVDERGFRFFTNYGSRKAEDLASNTKAAMVFHWGRLHRQVRIEGSVQRLSEQESAEYFRTRPRGSQIGAWASLQSSVLEGRSQLKRQFREHEDRFKNSEVPLPPFWGGFILAPQRIEFWQGRADRLHDRLSFTRRSAGWEVERLSP